MHFTVTADSDVPIYQWVVKPVRCQYQIPVSGNVPIRWGVKLSVRCKYKIPARNNVPIRWGVKLSLRCKYKIPVRSNVPIRWGVKLSVRCKYKIPARSNVPIRWRVKLSVRCKYKIPARCGHRLKFIQLMRDCCECLVKLSVRCSVRYLQGVDIGSSSFSWWEIVVSVSWSCADISDDDDTVAAAGWQLWRSCTSRLMDWCKPLSNTHQTVASNLTWQQQDVLIIIIRCLASIFPPAALC